MRCDNADKLRIARRVVGKNGGRAVVYENYLIIAAFSHERVYAFGEIALNIIYRDDHAELWHAFTLR